MHNPLDAYRRAQRELRRQFDAFTRANCPTCPTPCCVRPARILPTDILLAEATGWRANRPSALSATETDFIAEIAGRTADALHDPPESAEATPDAAPCEFLGPQGCTFP